MPFTVYWKTLAGLQSDQHTLHMPAIEQAMNMLGLGATGVYVITAAGRAYQAPTQMLDLMQHERAAATQQS